MKEIIFWFNKFNSKNYWFDYATKYCKSKFEKAIKYDDHILYYSQIEDWIKIGNLKIKFKVDRGENDPQHAGTHDSNQYWVEELFENNFEEFFMSIVKEEMKNGKSMEFSRFNRQKI